MDVLSVGVVEDDCSDTNEWAIFCCGAFFFGDADMEQDLRVG